MQCSHLTGLFLSKTAEGRRDGGCP